MNLPLSDPHIHLGQLQHPLGAATTAPCLVAGVFAVWMVAGIDGKHEHPDFSEILLESPNWGKLWSATVQFGLSFSV
jgi:hypothetical protein